MPKRRDLDFKIETITNYDPGHPRRCRPLALGTRLHAKHRARGRSRAANRDCHASFRRGLAPKRRCCTRVRTMMSSHRRLDPGGSDRRRWDTKVRDGTARYLDPLDGHISGRRLSDWSYF